MCVNACVYSANAAYMGVCVCVCVCVCVLMHVCECMCVQMRALYRLPRHILLGSACTHHERQTRHPRPRARLDAHRAGELPLEDPLADVLPLERLYPGDRAVAAHDHEPPLGRDFSHLVLRLDDVGDRLVEDLLVGVVGNAWSKDKKMKYTKK